MFVSSKICKTVYGETENKTKKKKNVYVRKGTVYSIEGHENKTYKPHSGDAEGCKRNDNHFSAIPVAKALVLTLLFVYCRHFFPLLPSRFNKYIRSFPLSF